MALAVDDDGDLGAGAPRRANLMERSSFERAAARGTSELYGGICSIYLCVPILQRLTQQDIGCLCSSVPPTKEPREHDHRTRHERHPLPDLDHARRLGRDEPRPRLLGRLPAHRTDADDGLEGHGFVFTIGRGNDVEVAAIARLAGAPRSAATSTSSSPTWARTWRELVHDSQLRWLGPEKGVMHMAIGAVVNALWDLRGQARRAAAVAAPRRD